MKKDAHNRAPDVKYDTYKTHIHGIILYLKSQ
jgi:hypothetical protein